MTKSITTRMQVPHGKTRYESPPEFLTHISEVYIQPGRVVVSHAFDTEKSYSSTTMSFATDADKLAYFNDSVVIANLAARRNYNENNGINLIDKTEI